MTGLVGARVRGGSAGAQGDAGVRLLHVHEPLDAEGDVEDHVSVTHLHVARLRTLRKDRLDAACGGNEPDHGSRIESMGCRQGSGEDVPGPVGELDGRSIRGRDPRAPGRPAREA